MALTSDFNTGYISGISLEMAWIGWRRKTNQDLGKVIIGNISEFFAVILGNDELLGRVRGIAALSV